MALLSWKIVQRGNVWNAVRGAGVVMGIRVVGAGLTFLSQVFLARVMGTFEFGIYSYAFVLLTVLSVLAPFGVDWAILRFIPEYNTQKQWGGLAGITRAAIGIVAGIAAVIALVAAGAVYLFSDRIGQHYVIPLYIALASLPLFALFQVYVSFARAFGWAALAYAPQFVLRPVLLIALVATVVVVGAAPTATAVLLASLAAAALAFAVHAGLFHRSKSAVAETAPPVYYGRHWLSVSFPMAMFTAFQLITVYGDVLILGNFVEPDKIGIYNAAVRTASMINFVLMAVSATTTPKYAELFAQHKHDELRGYVAQILHWVFWPSLAAGLVIVLGGKLILSAFGPAFVEGFPVLVLLVLSYLTLAAVGNVDSLLSMTGHQRACARVMIWTAVVFVVLNFALVPFFGVLGAAISVWSASIVKSAWLVVIAKKRLGILALVTPPKLRLGRRAAA